MEALPAMLESMPSSLVVITALVALGFFVTTLMLHLQGRMLRDVSKQVADSKAARARARRKA
ncbi:MAG TPA: hypothetical protein VMW56_16990 [Candidatus Margulisiibacteriota bacterium]|nr:hypothetical protein [Candidatus Margulisiibacteriota bacterium]